jgi:type II secretory pathway component PulF
MNPPTPRRPNLVLTLVVHAIAWALLGLALLVLAPRQAALFRSFNMKLPAPTEALLAFADLLVRYAPWAVGFVVGLLAGDGVVLYLLGRRERGRRLAWLWAAVVLVVPLVLAVGVALAVGFPFTRLVGGLGE